MWEGLEDEGAEKNCSNGSLPLKEIMEKRELNGNKKRKAKSSDLEPKQVDGHSDTKISKEERRELKRQRKLNNKQNQWELAELEETVPGNGAQEKGQTVGAEAERTAKARSRAAKKRAKENGDRKSSPLVSSKLGGDPYEAPHSSSPSPSPSKKIGSIRSTYTEDPKLTALPQTEIDAFLGSNFITATDPTSIKLLRPITKFSYLPPFSPSNVSPFANFKSPTPIQAAAWPYLLSSRDVIGIAETGSGKTLAFGVPCVRSICATSRSKHSETAVTKAVIISPTRELAVQIHEQISHLASPAGLNAVCIYGGVSKEPQRLALPTAHIVIGTPGRLNDLISEGAANLSGVTYLVLDEADRMLDKGFEDDIRKIIGFTPTPSAGRQTLMFTATWPASVRTLAATFMHNPVHISIGRENPTGALRANAAITQLVEVITPAEKESRLLQLITTHQRPGTAQANDRILVFCLYKKEAARVEVFLGSRLGGQGRNGRRVVAIHGGMAQPARSASLDAFRTGQCPILVATDVAARGLDIPAVKLVLNLTFPLTVEDYVHRIGRTGRAGSSGLAITLFTEHDKAQSGALINVLKAAGQPVPKELLRFGSTVKKKTHGAYGAFYRDLEMEGGAGAGGGAVGKKIRF